MNPPLESGLADPDVRVTTVFPSQRERGVLLMLGPAFVAAVAYVDPGNFATNSPPAPRTATGCCGSWCWRTSEPPESRAVTTIRDLVDGLIELAGMLPQGFKTRVELGVCDGEDLQLIENIDLDRWASMPPERLQMAEWFVLLRGHLHPGERAGELLHRAASHVDQDLRELADENGDHGPDDSE
jgi:hypothetical protein